VWYDIKNGIIPDVIILPAIALIAGVKYMYNDLHVYDLYAVMMVVFLFVVPIALNMAFGGGDIRYGIFAALFVGLQGVGWFVMLSGLFHFILLSVFLKKSTYPFAPAMFAGALCAYAINGV
jgi:prepilin signal peptidase PulO-like enzyme (type II secretory pathway)